MPSDFEDSVWAGEGEHPVDRLHRARAEGALQDAAGGGRRGQRGLRTQESRGPPWRRHTTAFLAGSHREKGRALWPTMEPGLPPATLPRRLLTLAVVALRPQASAL